MQKLQLLHLRSDNHPLAIIVDVLDILLLSVELKRLDEEDNNNRRSNNNHYRNNNNQSRSQELNIVLDLVNRSYSREPKLPSR